MLKRGEKIEDFFVSSFNCKRQNVTFAREINKIGFDNIDKNWSKQAQSEIRG
jgi:hypothetical protein